MNWIEIFQVVGPVALGGAGIFSGYRIARSQSRHSVEAEARFRTYDACTALLGAAEQAITHLVLHDGSTGTQLGSFPELPPIGALLAQTNVAAASCQIVSDGRIAPLASDLSFAIARAAAVVGAGGDDDAGQKALDELNQAKLKFAALARFEITPGTGLRQREKHAK